MSNLTPVEPPDLLPLKQSFEYDQLETELKSLFITVFNDKLRPLERRLNLYGIPHRGDIELIERAMKDAGLAIMRRNEVRAGFLLKAARSRNPRRGLHFLRQYLQSVWPNVWMVEPLWHPVASAANYPADRAPLAKKDLGSGVTAEYDPDANDGEPKVYRTDWQGKQRLYKTARKNYLSYSEEFDNAGWSKTGITVTPDASTAPNGTVTCDRLVEAATTAQRRLHRTVAGVTSGDTFTWSVHVRPDAGREGNTLYLSSGTENMVVDFNLLTKTFVATPSGGAAHVDSGIVQLVSGDYRLYTTVKFATPKTSIAVSLYFSNIPDDGNASYAGDGVKGIGAWGAQLESGYLSSYIKTGAAAVIVTDYTLDANGVATFAQGPAPTPLIHFLTPRIRVTLPVQTDNGMGLVEIGKAFRSTLAARLMLELRLSTLLENIGETGGLALANGAHGIMPFTAIGTLMR